MKHWLALILVVLLSTTLCVGVSAEDVTDFDYVLSTVERPEGGKIAAGEEFAVEVSLTAVEKLAMVEYHFRYDKTLMEPVRSTTEGFLSDCVMMNANIAPARNDAESEVYGEIWITGMADTDKVVAEGEVISTIVFKALKDITEDSPMVGYYADGCDAAFADYVCGMVNGGVVIGAADATDIPADMTAPIDNAAPTPGEVIIPDSAGTENESILDNTGSSSDNTIVIVAVIILAVLAAAGVTVALVVAKKR